MLKEKDQIIYNRLQSLASMVKYALQEIQKKQKVNCFEAILKSMTNDLEQAKEIYKSKEWYIWDSFMVSIHNGSAE